jgi:hypothetical protein
VLSGDPECLPGGNGSELLLSYFCGYGPGCSDASSRGALQRAKRAVEEQYSVVGLVERRNLSLAVMEAFLPRWFRGLTLLPERTSNANRHPAPARPVIKELRRRLALDYDFYAFVERRLLVQADGLNNRV